MSAQLTKKSHPIEWLKVKDLGVQWAEAQRTLSRRKVDSIINEFDPDAFGVLVVASLNGDGYHLIDGQHRAAAAMVVLGPEQTVPCEIIAGVDTAREAARVWLGRNTHQTKPNPLERFQRQVVAGEPEAVTINKIVKKGGFSVGVASLQAVVACQSAYRKHGEQGLSWVLGARAVRGRHVRERHATARAAVQPQAVGGTAAGVRGVTVVLSEDP